MILENYLEQHENIKTQIAVIEKLSVGNGIEKNAAQIGKEISHLAGVIKVHLSSEEKFMYPKLIESTDEVVQRTAKSYQTEMGNLLEVFTVFKDKYNTKPRIIENRASFSKDLKEITYQLMKRMDKEEKELYKLL